MPWSEYLVYFLLKPRKYPIVRILLLALACIPVLWGAAVCAMYVFVFFAVIFGY